MALFEKKPEISRSKLRETLKKADGQGKLNPQQRVRLEQEAFGKKYGDFISKGDYQRGLRELRQKRFSTRDYQEKLKLDRQIRFLEDLEKSGGK